MPKKKFRTEKKEKIMAYQKVKATLVSCWGNPTGALEVLRQFNNTNDQNFIRHGLSKLCCLLTPLGFNCSMSFWHNLEYHIIFSYCNITIGKEQFTFLGNEKMATTLWLTAAGLQISSASTRLTTDSFTTPTKGGPWHEEQGKPQPGCRIPATAA